MISPKLERLKKEAGNRLFVSLSGSSLTKSEISMLREVSPCGIIYFKRNVESCESLESLIKSTKCFESIEFHSIDEEGGRVRRLPKDNYSLPSMKELVTYGKETAAEKIGILAQKLNETGINMNMAPNVDLRSGEDNSIVGDRSFGENPETVVDFAGIYIKKMQEHGVFPVIKHFPGHGTTVIDSHSELPLINKPFDDLLREDLVPYRRLANTAGFVMKAHLLLPEISELPASLSPEWDKILRKDLNFMGISMTDDIEMHALDRFSAKEKTELFFKSGTDKLLICSGKEEAILEMHEAAVKFLETK
jgi:beta-N-acetylhexosaminidase